MRILVAFVVGCLFGGGLLISGMTNTQKVQGWLDVFGAWDPTLAFVMFGAILPMAFAWRLTRKRAPALGGIFPTLPEPRIGRDLVIGSILFGIGWGLVGLCPGPAMASLGFGGINGFIFFCAMVAGMIVTPALAARLDRVALPV